MKVIGSGPSEKVRRIAERVNSTSNADFVRRLLDEGRKVIVNPNGSVSTHELGYRDDGEGNAVVYPLVQSVNGGNAIHRFDDDMAYDRALYNGDTLLMFTPEAKAFTEGYKEVYPGFDQYAPVPGMAVGSRYMPQWSPEVGLLGPYFEGREVAQEPVEPDLFSEEALERRALKQRYAESGFRDNAVSGAGAQGAWQIMPITLEDYLGRGRGKKGDLNDPEYNRKVRDWVMSIIPGDLGEFYSENDAPLTRLAKLYGAYNWGAGNMRKYLRKQRDAGVDINNGVDWVEGLNPETKRYIKYLAFDEDIPDSTAYTNSAFEKAAMKRGYLKCGGKMYRDGGDKDDEGIYLGELPPAVVKPEPVKVVLRTDGISKDTPITHSTLIGPGMLVSKGMDDPSYNLFRSNCSDATGEILESISGVDLTKGITTPYGLARRVSDVFGGYPGYMERFNGLDAIQSFEVPWYDYRVARDIATKKRADYVDSAMRRAGVSDERRNAAIENVYNSSPLLPYRLNEEASGGKIHIKPENRGKFTALKKRTGHSASWFKAHGTPAQKKMAVFELNSRKWKHGDGGPLDKYGDDAVRDALRVILKNRSNSFEDGGEEKKKTPFWQRMIQIGSMAEAPAVMTASGMEVKPDGTITYGNDSEGVRQLRNNLVGIGSGAASGIGMMIAAPYLPRFVPHVFKVLADPMKATTAVGRYGSALADSWGLVSGLRGLSDDISKASSGRYGVNDIPGTLLNGTVMIPGGTLLTDARTLGNMAEAAKTVSTIPRVVSGSIALNRLAHPIETYRFAKIAKNAKEYLPEDIYQQSLSNLSRAPFYNRPPFDSDYNFINRAPADDAIQYRGVYDWADVMDDPYNVTKYYDSGEFWGLGDRNANNDFSRAHEFGHLVQDSALDLGYLPDNIPPKGYKYKGDSRPHVQQVEYTSDVIGSAIAKDAETEKSADILYDRIPFARNDEPVFVKIGGNRRGGGVRLEDVSEEARKGYDRELKNYMTALADGDADAISVFKRSLQKQIDQLRAIGVIVPDI